MGTRTATSTRHTIALALALVALLTRWPLRSVVLDELDSAHYALAVLRFSIVESRPHPPGYVFFVWAAQAFNHVLGDPVAALSALSAVSGALSIALLFELLAPALGPLVAGTACVATLFAPQVWIQQTRPMQDSFAFLWLVVLTLAIVGTERHLSLYSWILVSALIGAAGGAKQILPLFAGGLVVWIGRAAWRRGGVRWLVAGLAAAAAGSFAWVVPLSINAGSLRVYLAHAAEQVHWQGQNDAMAFGAVRSQFIRTLEATFLTASEPKVVALSVWVLASVGAAVLWHRRQARWIFWLLAPLLLVRILLLGPPPRFALYYLPFVIALAIYGLETLTVSALCTPLTARLTLAGVVAAWVALQVSHVLPTLQALRRGPAPLASAVLSLRSRFPTGDVLVVGSGGVLGRQLMYYAERYGVRAVEETEDPRPVAHVVQVAPGSHLPRSSWAWGGQLIGRWALDVPNSADLGAPDDIWNVVAFELYGPQVALRRWRTNSSGGWSATQGSRIVIFRSPPREFTVRLHARAQGPVEFSVDGVRIAEWDGRGREYALRVTAGARTRLAIDIRLRCAEQPNCLELDHLEVVP